MAIHRQEAGLRHSPNLVISSTGPLKKCRNCPWRTDLDHQVHRSDIDTKFKGGGRHKCPQLARAQEMFDVMSPFVRHGAVMSGNNLIRVSHETSIEKGFTELMGKPLGQATTLHKYQRGGVGRD